MRRSYWILLAGSLASSLGCSTPTTESVTPPADVVSETASDTASPDDVPADVPAPSDVRPPMDVDLSDGTTPPVDADPSDGGTPPQDGGCSNPGETRCGESCVDTMSSNAHCGACGNACMGTQVCMGGVCRDPMTCPSGQALCGNVCVNTQTDAMNCGACGNACTAGQTCSGGVCGTPMMCPSGQTSCANSCVDTQADSSNCGTCGTVCPMDQSCQAGTCRPTTMCPAGQTACGGSCVDTQTDLANCGTCGNACPSGQVCAGGMCRTMDCPAGQTRCGSTCVNVMTDAANCGSCGRSCGMGQTCTGGNCMGTVMCPAGQVRCGDACADTQTDPTNCGACGTACPAGNTCVAGACRAPRPTCMGTETDCTPMANAPTCVDTMTSNANCGACGNACPAGQTCAMGSCACATGQTLCGRTCVNTQTDSANCGACGRACPMGQSCTAGTCACPMGQTVCNGACVNTQSDNANCGMCGRACPAGQSCSGGTCACPMGQTACGAACVNTQTDRANCGMCGRACTVAGQTCTAGACACPAGQTACGTGAAAACVDTMSSASNCGMCGRVCETGTSCMGGVCRGAPPANDTRAGATVINLAMPSQTIAADTRTATNNGSSCRCTSGNDVFYRFTLTQPEVIYADTFGATWDTSLYLQDSMGANLSGALATAPNVACNDDHQMAGFCTGTVGTNLQSQIAARLPAGTYFLVLSGCGSGTADIHFQHLPAGNGTHTRILPTAMEQTVTGTVSGSGTVTSTCCSGGADNTHWWITCPGTAAQTFYASTCNAMTGVSLAAYDIEVAQYSALRPTGAVCNDDVGGVCGNGASLGSTIPATGASLGGLNTLIADACSGTGAYSVRYSLTAPCATGTRCGAACVDTNTDVNNCGACDRRCAAGNACIAGACIAPPANDTPATARTIDMAVPQTIITGIDTRAAVNNTSGSCGCTSGRDIFFNFTVPAGAPEIIYADTLGSNWDTSLFVQTSTGTNVTATGLPTNGIACNDDGGLSGCSTGLQSQILLQLNPGAYRLVISGCGTGGTTTNLRFQHAPVGNGAVAFLGAGSSTPGGTVAGAGRVNLGCGGGGPENTYYWFRCASATTAGTFSASTCGRATWDTSLSQYSPGRSTPGANVCSDDACSLQSSVTSTIPAGPGLHMLYVDTFTGRTPGTYTVSVSRP